MRGETGADEARVEEAILDADVTSHPHDVRLVPVVRRRSDLVVRATPTTRDGPAMLRGLTLADGMAVVQPGGGTRGSGVQVLPLP
jgi:molybdopterin molybdotransferase